MSGSLNIVQRILPQISLISIKTTANSVPPIQYERAELQALIIHEDGSLAGAGIPVNWRIADLANGQNLSFYDTNDQLLHMNQGEVTSFTNSNSLATVRVASPSITIATIYASTDPDQPEYGVQLISHDPSGNNSSYQAPFIAGLQDVLNIPNDADQSINPDDNDVLFYDTRYAVRADTDKIPTLDYRCAFILNNECVSIQNNVSADTEVYAYIPYNQMYSDATTINTLKYIVSETNSGQSSPLHFLAQGTAYEMPDPFITTNSQLNKPLFTGALDNGILTANSFVNGYLSFNISSFPFSCLYGLFKPMLFLDGWDPHDNTTKITRQISLYSNDFYLQQSHLNSGIDLTISQRVFRQIGAYKENNIIEYADLYLNYSINEVDCSIFYYNKADFSGLDN